MKALVGLRGPYAIARQEFLANLKSVRLIVMVVILALVVVGGAYGLSASSGSSGPQLSPITVWGHYAIGLSGENLVVVWVSDPFGEPLVDRSVFFLAEDDGTEVQLGEDRTDRDGFARLAIGERTEILVLVRSGVSEFRFGLDVTPPPFNFTTSFRQEDFDGDGVRDDLGIHVLTVAGAPATAQIYVDDVLVTVVDRLGYGRVALPIGESNVTVQVGGESETRTVHVHEPEPRPSFTPPDFALLVIASFFTTYVVPIFAIVISFDTISKERVQGTLDLLLSRPISRMGAVLGKAGGTFASVAVPVTLTNLVGIGIVTVASGEAPTGSFAAAFLGLGLLLIAFYVLLQITLSSLAKTGGTAIMFGVVAWLAFSILYPVITLVLSTLAFGNDFEARFRFAQVAGLGNPSAIYQQLVAFAAPESFRFTFPGSTLDLPIVAGAATLWIIGLLALALWTFERKAVE